MKFALVIILSLGTTVVRAELSVESWRSDGETHAERDAIITFGYAAPIKGRLILIREGHNVCAVRFKKYSRAHDATRGNAFNSGEETFEAEYDWYSFADANKSSVPSNLRSGHATLRRSGTIGIGRVVVPSKSAELKCGAITGLSWNYPMYISMFKGAKQQDVGVLVAPTAWSDIREVEPSNVGLAWYGFQETRKTTYVPLSALPPK